MATIDSGYGLAGASSAGGKAGGGLPGQTADLDGRPSTGQASGAATREAEPPRFELTRFGRLAQELIRVVPSQRLGVLASKVEHETGEPVTLT